MKAQLNLSTIIALTLLGTFSTQTASAQAAVSMGFENYACQNNEGFIFDDSFEASSLDTNAFTFTPSSADTLINETGTILGTLTLKDSTPAGGNFNVKIRDYPSNPVTQYVSTKKTTDTEWQLLLTKKIPSSDIYKNIGISYTIKEHKVMRQIDITPFKYDQVGEGLNLRTEGNKTDSTLISKTESTSNEYTLLVPFTIIHPESLGTGYQLLKSSKVQMVVPTENYRLSETADSEGNVIAKEFKNIKIISGNIAKPTKANCIYEATLQQSVLDLSQLKNPIQTNSLKEITASPKDASLTTTEANNNTESQALTKVSPSFDGVYPTNATVEYSLSDQRFSIDNNGLVQLKAGQSFAENEVEVKLVITATDNSIPAKQIPIEFVVTISNASFVKLDTITGAPTTTNDYGCVKDTASGLTWEVKKGINTTWDPKDEGLHDKDARFKWYMTDTSIYVGSTGSVTSGYYCHEAPPVSPNYSKEHPDLCNTKTFINKVNAEEGGGLCKRTNWRLPTRAELRTLRNNPEYSNIGAYFPNFRSDLPVWTADNEGISAYDYLFNTNVSVLRDKTGDMSLRLVSSP